MLHALWLPEITIRQGQVRLGKWHVNRLHGIFVRDKCRRSGRVDVFLLFLNDVSVDVYWNDVETPPPDVIARQEKALIENIGKLKGEIPRLKNKLIEDLRSLLAGGSN